MNDHRASEPLPITAIVLTYNEEAVVRDTLDSIRPLVRRTVVVDSGSGDRTVEIVRDMGVEVIEHEFVNYSRQRNWAQDRLVSPEDWVFHLDAGERLSEALRDEVRSTFSTDDSRAGYLMPRKTIFRGRWIKHGGLYPTYHARLFQARYGACENRRYDQHYLVDGETEVLDSPLLDEAARDLEQWTLRHLEWARCEAEEVTSRDQGEAAGRKVEPDLSGSPIERRRWFKTLYYRLPLFARSIGYFFVRYVFLLGFLDGLPGLVYHGLHGGWYRFMVDTYVWMNEADRSR